MLPSGSTPKRFLGEDVKLSKRTVAGIISALLVLGGSYLLWDTYGHSTSNTTPPAVLAKQVHFAQAVHAFDVQVIRLGDAIKQEQSPEINNLYSVVKKEDKNILTFLKKNSGIKHSGIPYPSDFTIPEGQIRHAVATKNVSQVNQAIGQLALMNSRIAKVDVTSEPILQSTSQNIQEANKLVIAALKN